MTQEYTPVSWQDETTSQQGTLINAERLNQMQTAHHFADGLEEVDAIPTADPGVEYHKIVYCTADSTLYRWDGTQWTADIDDETKRLLEEEIARATEAERTIQGYLDAHEANHNNPHVVTKAQVGLGNCDNTADLDKPISTATQAALDGKADKATTLAGYGITDAYTKSQADALLANKADKADTYTKSQVDGFLGGKVDKLGSSPAGTYKSVTVNAQGQVTAGTNPDTLAGYGITDAYTKGEADTLLAGKADQATTYTKTEIDTLLGAKANDNAVVKLTGNQTIAGVKTFTSDMVLSTSVNRQIQFKTTGIATNGTVPSTQSDLSIKCVANDNSQLSNIITRTYTNGARAIRVALNATNGTYKIMDLVRIEADGTGWMEGIARAYDPTHTTDVATIGTLDAYTPMVRTTGAQTIAGIKTHTDEIGISKNGRLMTMKCTGVTIGNNQSTGAIVFEDSTSAVIGSIYFNTRTDGATELMGRVRNGNGTFKDITLGAGDA